MDGACIRYTELPGTSRLFADYLYDFAKVASFYRHNPREASSFQASYAAIDYPDSRRAALVSALAKINDPQSPNLRRLAQPGTACVVTGQQVGLFTGPAYTVYKAVTAASAARELSSNGIPAVPVFWLATEDHDFPEIAAAHVYDIDANIRTSRVETSGPADRPVGPIVPDRGFPIEELEASLRGLPYADEVLALVRDAHAGNPSMGAAFRETLRRLLAPLDLIFLDPLEPAIRAIGAPFIENAVQVSAASPLYADLLERNRQLAAAGYHAQVHVEADTSLFFLLENGRRINLQRQQDGSYLAGKDRRLAPADLAASAASVSPNALLRPVLQDYLLPSVAYVGGPAELAYFAQSEVLYRALLGRMPVMLPRNAYTLISPRVQKLMTRYGLDLPGLMRPHAKLREAVSQMLVPAHLKDLMQQSEDGLKAILRGLESNLLAFDPSLAKALTKSRSKMEYQLGKMAAKTARETLRRDERAAAETAHLANQVFPDGHLQERYFSILPFVAQYGLDLIPRIAAQSCLDCVDHHLLHLN